MYRSVSILTITVGFILFFLIPVHDVADAQDFHIVPIGNSITQAQNSSTYSYRYNLWIKLIDEGIDFDLVGPFQDVHTPPNPAWPTYLGQSFDQDHNGKWGIMTDEHARALYDWLDGYHPDIALVHLGSNDLLTTSEENNTILDLKKIISLLRNRNPRVSIFIAQLIPNADAGQNGRITVYNALIPGVATDMADPKSPIFIVDQNTGFDVATDTYDGTHPNAFGEEKMAEKWRQAIRANIDAALIPAIKHTWLGITSNWATASNWNPPSVPGPTNDVYIPAGAANMPVISSDLVLGTTCGDITMDGASTLTVDGNLTIPSGYILSSRNSSSIIVSGNVTINGNYNPGQGSLILNGTGAADISANQAATFGGGRVDRSTGTWEQGDFYEAAGYNIFDCYAPFVLHSAKVYVDDITNTTAGIKTFYWATSDGTVQESVDVFIDPADGEEQRVDLNFHIPTGTNHRIGVLSPGAPALYQCETWIVVQGIDYPNLIGDIAQLNTSGDPTDPLSAGAPGLTHYFYLYDYEYSKALNNLEISKNGATVTTTSDLNIGGNLTISVGSLAIGSQTAVTAMSGTITNNVGTAGLVIKSDVNGTGSLLHNTNNVNATVEQRLTALEWHYVSSPISNATANVFYGSYLKSFDETSWDWNPTITDASEGLTVAKGYSAWVPGSTTTVSFEGPMNNGNQSIGITATVALTNDGWNLVGNPFASSLDWDASSGWTRPNVDNTVYFWEGVGGTLGAGNYWTYNGTTQIGTGDATRYIPAMQGFIIHTTATGTLQINNNARTHSSQAYWKSGADQYVNSPFARLRAIDAADLWDETIIRFHEEATPEHDGAFDAFKLNGYQYPQLYSFTAENTKLAINTLPVFNVEDSISLGFLAPSLGEYAIQLIDFDSFESGTMAYLEDKLTGEIHNLSENPTYPFVAAPDDDQGRFLMWFTFIEHEDAPELKKEARVYAYRNNVMVKLPEDTDYADVSVYNMLGQVVQNSKLSSSTNTFHVNSVTGSYIVVVQSDGWISKHKVFIE